MPVPKPSGEMLSTLSADGNDVGKVVRGKAHNVGIEKDSILDSSKSKPNGNIAFVVLSLSLSLSLSIYLSIDLSIYVCVCKMRIKL